MNKDLPYTIPAEEYIKCAFPWDKTDKSKR